MAAFVSKPNNLIFDRRTIPGPRSLLSVPEYIGRTVKVITDYLMCFFCRSRNMATDLGCGNLLGQKRKRVPEFHHRAVLPDIDQFIVFAIKPGWRSCF